MTIPTIHRAEPAFSVIEKLGGKTAVAGRLKLDKSTLSRWCQMPPAGTGGMIPQRYWRELIEMAQESNVDLAVRELVAVEV